MRGYKSCEDEANRVIVNQPIASSAAFLFHFSDISSVLYVQAWDPVVVKQDRPAKPV